MGSKPIAIGLKDSSLLPSQGLFRMTRDYFQLIHYLIGIPCGVQAGIVVFFCAKLKKIVDMPHMKNL